MSLKERIKENLESEEISAALTDYLEDMGGQLLDEARQAPEFELAPKADKRLARTLRHNLYKRNPVHLWRRKFVLAAIALLLFLSAVHASAIRSAITNFFINRQEESIDFSELREPDNQTWLTNISLPSFIPPGYELAKFEAHEQVQTFIYTHRGSKDQIRLTVYADNTSVRINNEKADTETFILIHGQQGYYNIINRKMQLFWGKGPAFLLEGPGSEEKRLIQMAESIVTQSEGLE